MRVVIHAGMHKTGSSAVQQHFAGHPTPGVSYAPWNEGNHCGLFILLFEDPEKAARYHGFVHRGPEYIAQLPAMREEWLARLRATMDAAGNDTVVFSAEDISLPIYRDAVVRMRDFFAAWTDRIDVVAYARSPRSFAVSAFQQMVKDGLNRLAPEELWPHYRARFELLDQIFGADRVDLRTYDRAELIGGDIVRDFAAVLGVAAGGQIAPDVNATLSAEATALLFAQRKLGDNLPTGFPGAQVANHVFTTRMSALGHSRFDFSDALWAPVMQRHADDMAWIQARMGRPLVDRRAQGAISIGSEGDLLALAHDSRGLIEKALRDCIAQPRRPDLRDTIRAVDQLRKLST